MADQPKTLFHDLMTAILTAPGDTPSSLRTTLAHQAARMYDSTPPDEGAFPAEIEAFVRKVALHAYRVTERDIEQLREHHYTEDAIFEIALSVASGVSQACLTSGLKALEGARNEIEEH